MREQLIPQNSPDDDKLGSAKPESPKLHEVLTPVFDKVEVLLPGINRDGLKEESAGFYTSDDTSFPRNTLINSTQYLPLFNALAAPEGQVRKEELTKLLSGKVVLDLGSGKDPTAYQIASFCGAKGYIAVDRGFAHHLLYNVKNHVRPDPDIGGSELRLCPIVIIREDMRRFVQRVPTNSVCVFTFGIDVHILGKMSTTDHKQLRSEIGRIVHPEGAQIADRESRIGGKDLTTNETFRGHGASQYFILTKKES